MTERLLTARELAEFLGVSSSTILDHWEAGELPGFRLFRGVDTRGRPTGAVRFRLSEVLTWLEGCREGRDARGDASPAPSVIPARGVVSQASPAPIGGEHV
ncbi:MAG: helix-turn-helix transcriptional regulator [Gaiellaceae bacterium]